jgi:hypothetical protein
MSLAIRSPLLAWAAATSLLAGLPAHASLTATVSTDIAAARTQFLAQATVLGAYDWSSLFAPGAHSFGSLGPNINAMHLDFLASDGALNSVVGVTGGATLSPGNWIDGPGFNSANGQAAAADLALNGAESFDLVFGSAYTSVGLAVASGRSNAPTEVDLLGASFDFIALGAQGQTVGTASLVLAAGAPAEAWVTLVASAPIVRLQVRETNAVSIYDQYFSNIYATPAVVTSVPEPGSWLMLGLGLGLTGWRLGSRRQGDCSKR